MTFDNIDRPHLAIVIAGYLVVALVAPERF